jgi:NADPH:quinone reductase-like Zn-dependent oxidoreductase
MGVQLAAAQGATVITTAAARNHALLRDLGATPVAYGPGLAGRVRDAAPPGISAAVDFAGTDEALDVSLELAADRARIASITGPPRRAVAGIKLLGYGRGQDAGTSTAGLLLRPRRHCGDGEQARSPAACPRTCPSAE